MLVQGPLSPLVVHGGLRVQGHGFTQYWALGSVLGGSWYLVTQL